MCIEKQQGSAEGAILSGSNVVSFEMFKELKERSSTSKDNVLSYEEALKQLIAEAEELIEL